MQHRARKRFGQNFLTDNTVIGRIVDAIAAKPGQLVLEIGPGQAALTEPLADSGCDLQLLEIDRDLSARLNVQFATRENVTVHTGDALRTDFAEISGGRPFRLVGNLPYNISTPLLFHVLEWSELVTDMHFMLQQEVVKRMAAVPGGKAWGKLSIMCQYRCAVTPLFDVAPEAFSPSPKVQSAIVRLVPHRKPPVQIDDMELFKQLVNRAFSQRRKTLRNALQSQYERDTVMGALEHSGLDGGRRGETLSVAEFASLTDSILAASHA